MTNITDDIAALKREILELKTAKLLPSNMNTYTAALTAQSTEPEGATWTIKFADIGNTAPITRLTFASNTFEETYARLFALLPFDSATNTQKIKLTLYFPIWNTANITVLSTRPIESITHD